MKIVRIHRFGGPEVLVFEDVEPPEPAGDEVLVRVKAASVNPIDIKQRTGQALKEKDLPHGLGRDLAGDVVAVGPQQREVAVGDAVLAHIDWDRSAYAEQVIVKAEELARKPQGLSWSEAGGLPLVANTAWQGLVEQGGLKAGQRVLVHGASGGVGQMAVQFAKQQGATVFATAGKSSAKAVQALGADRVVDHDSERFEDVATDLDLVFDLIGGETRERSWALLKPAGVLVTTVHGEVEQEARQHNRMGKGYSAHPDGEALARFAQQAADGSLKVAVAKTFPFASVAEAQRFQQDDHPHGKVVLTF